VSIDYSAMAFPKPSDKAGPAPKKRISRKPKPTREVSDKSGQGKRLVLSNADWDKLRRYYWKTHPVVTCGICGKPVLGWEDFELDHIDGRGFGGSRRDDRRVQASHRNCNREKGSRRNFKIPVVLEPAVPGQGREIGPSG
jgi:HNH endonuclease